ncbi:MAG: patatin-like phospholipase family protein [Clostridia bacterium]|nr:patatin-like phospholipase family protein [Clostridia bacterium]
MKGLILEGGGAKGAFHMGALKALREAGHEFDFVCGTSVGAMNGALIAQGDYDVALDWWKMLDTSRLFGFKKQASTVALFTGALRSMIKNGGLDTSKIREILARIIDEDKLRSSAVDFGMITYSLTRRQPLRLYKEDIPRGKLVDYLMASGNLPVFKTQPLDGENYLDGSFYDNCPVNLALERGCDDVVIIRTYTIRPIRSYPKEGLRELMIKPSVNLGGVLDFSRSALTENFNAGYCETKRVTDDLLGETYFIARKGAKPLSDALYALSDAKAARLASAFGYPAEEPRRTLLYLILPEAARLLGASALTCDEVLMRLMEYEARKRGVPRFKLYGVRDFAERIFDLRDMVSYDFVTNSVFSPAGVEITGREFFLSTLCDVYTKSLIDIN